jgi:hypothetical protein
MMVNETKNTRPALVPQFSLLLPLSFKVWGDHGKPPPAVLLAWKLRGLRCPVSSLWPSESTSNHHKIAVRGRGEVIVCKDRKEHTSSTDVSQLSATAKDKEA